MDRDCRLAHISLAGGWLELQKQLATDMAGAVGAVRLKSALHDLDTIELHRVHIADALSGGGARTSPSSLLVCPLHQYMKRATQKDALRLVPVLAAGRGPAGPPPAPAFPCICLATMLGGMLRLVAVHLETFHQRAVWPITQLVDPALPPDATPLGLPVDRLVHSLYLSVHFGRIPVGLPFHVVTARVELLVLLYTLAILRDWDRSGCLDALVTGDHPDCTSATAWLRSDGRGGLVSLTDLDHQLVLQHDPRRHEALVLMWPMGLAVTFRCPWCGSHPTALPSGGRCRHCGTTILQAMARASGVELCIRGHLSPPGRPTDRRRTP